MPWAASVPTSKPDRPLENLSGNEIIRTIRHRGRPGVRQGSVMNPMKIVGIVLIVAGAAALAYGGFSYTKETHNAEIGPLKVSVKEKEQVDVPASVRNGATGLGVVLVLIP